MNSRKPFKEAGVRELHRLETALHPGRTDRKIYYSGVQQPRYSCKIEAEPYEQTMHPMWHPRDQCPAKDATCHNCQRKAHFSAHCYSKTKDISTLHKGDTAFLDTMSSSQAKAWFSRISIGDQETLVKLVKVTAVSKETWQLLEKSVLQPPDEVYMTSLRALGSVHLSHKGKSSKQVVNGLKSNVLGLPPITSLHLAVRVDSTSV